MSERVVAISLKIPDNAAFTALVTLRRLGVGVARVERSEIWQLEDDADPATLPSRVEHNEAVFNPNKHRLTLLPHTMPRAGEVWIDEIDDGADRNEVRAYLGGTRIAGVTSARRYVAWRLFDEKNAPVPRSVVADAVERLLCNPAIERAIF